MAGYDWVNNFLKRNPKLSVRKPEATNVNRILAFNKTELDRFFANLEKVREKYPTISQDNIIQCRRDRYINGSKTVSHYWTQGSKTSR